MACGLYRASYPLQLVLIYKRTTGPGPFMYVHVFGCLRWLITNSRHALQTTIPSPMSVNRDEWVVEHLRQVGTGGSNGVESIGGDLT